MESWFCIWDDLASSLNNSYKLYLDKFRDKYKMFSMNIQINNPKVRSAAFTILFYCLYISIALITELIYPSLHAPNIGMLMLMILPFIAGLLLFINTIQLFYKSDCEITISVHLFILVVFFVLFAIYR